MKHILLVEDDETIAIGIQFVLEKEGYSVQIASSLMEAKRDLEKEINLILLDLNLPDGLGYSLCQEIRNIKEKDIPIIFLTVRDDEEDMVRGLDMGADDYITKPFKMRVLLSRIQAVLRRTTQNEISNQQGILICKNIVCDTQKTKVYKEGKEIILSKSEYKLLVLLMENKNKTINREQILDYLWGIDGAFVNDNTLTVTMKRLREKIEEDRINNPIIQTVRGIGYRMEDGNE